MSFAKDWWRNGEGEMSCTPPSLRPRFNAPVTESFNLLDYQRFGRCLSRQISRLKSPRTSWILFICEIVYHTKSTPMNTPVNPLFFPRGFSKKLQNPSKQQSWRPSPCLIKYRKLDRRPFLRPSAWDKDSWANHRGSICLFRLKTISIPPEWAIAIQTPFRKNSRQDFGGRYLRYYSLF